MSNIQPIEYDSLKFAYDKLKKENNRLSLENNQLMSQLMVQQRVTDKKVNCLTRALWFWNRYGGIILYDEHHATVCKGKRVYYDPYPTENMVPLDMMDINRIKKGHADFLTDDEVEILKRYFKQ